MRDRVDILSSGRPMLVLSVLLFSAGCTSDKDTDTGDTGDVVGADTEAPVIALLGDDPDSVEHGGVYADPGATVTDNVDTGLVATVTGSIDTSVLGAQTLSYDAVDSAGNAAETVERTVEVVDTVAPVITLNGDSVMVIEEGSVFVDPGATVTDNADTDLIVAVSGAVDTSTVGTYTLSYGAVDSSGNVAATVERTVEVVFTGQLIVAASGSDLVLVGLSKGGVLTERAVASLDAELAGYNTNHQIFGLAKDPSANIIYATSFNECGALPLVTDGCWGNARIDRYTYDAGSITHDGIAYLAQVPLRLVSTDFDAKASTLTFTLLNQGADAISVTSGSVDGLPKDATLSSSCSGVTLASGDSCGILIDGITDKDSSFDLLVETDEAVFDAFVYYDSTLETFRAYGFDPDWQTEPAAPDCISDTWEPDQYGGCALTALAISSDSTRVYVNEDNEDEALVFALDKDGAMTFLSQSTDGVDLQGIAVNDDNTAIYNGSRAYSVSADVITAESDGEGGNATEVIEVGGVELLVSTINNDSLEIYSLVDPFSPKFLASLTPKTDELRFQHHSADGSIFALVGFTDITTASFDGATLTELDSLEIALDVGTCKKCDYDAYARAVQVTADGTQAVAAFFVNAYDEETLTALSVKGGLTSFSIDPKTGALSELSTLGLPGMSRNLLFVDAL